MATPAVPYNQFSWFAATVTSGAFSAISGVSAEYQTTYTDWAPWGFTLGWGAKMLIDNNHFEGPGQTVYIEPDGVRDDVVFQHNLIFWPQDHLPRTDNPLWNGLRYNVRNPMEVKRGRRWLVDGNLFDGAWSHQNQGQPIMVWGVGSYSESDTQVGALDWTITDNVVRNAAVMGQLGGWAKRALIANNLGYNLNRDFWDDGIGSPGIFWSGHWMLESAPEDVTIRNNTLGPARGLGPAILITGGVDGLGEGLKVQDNLMYMDLGNGTKHGPVMLDEEQNEPTHPRIPAFTGTTLPTILGGVFARLGASIVSNYQFGNNVVIGGQTSRTQNGAWRDLTQSEVDSYAAELTGNFLPGGNTLAAREMAAGLPNAESNDFRLAESSPYKAGAAHPATSGGDIGVNYVDLEAARGLVSNIAVRPEPKGALISYTAPDTRACWVGTSADGTNWTSTVDGGVRGSPRLAANGGGTRGRSVLVANLAPATAYRFRIQCYFAQRPTDGNSNEYRPDQITDGTFTTLPAR